MNIVICIFIALSLFFAFAGVVGMLRMPDTYSRMAVKLAVLGIFYIITNPIASHALAKGAYHHGVRPEKEMVCDKYGEDLE